MTDQHNCSGEVYDAWRSYGCSVNAKYEEDGKWWCKRHLPSNQAAKRQAKIEQNQRAAQQRAADNKRAYEHAEELTERLGVRVTAIRQHHNDRWLFVLADEH